MSNTQSNTKFQKHAVVYCRVSSKKQKTEDSGLGSQEYRCRQYADAKGYIVDEAFPDDVSGKGDFMKRKGMVALLNYLDRNRLSYALSGLSAKNEPLHAMSRWRAVAVAGS